MSSKFPDQLSIGYTSNGAKSDVFFLSMTVLKPGGRRYQKDAPYEYAYVYLKSIWLSMYPTCGCFALIICVVGYLTKSLHHIDEKNHPKSSSIFSHMNYFYDIGSVMISFKLFQTIFSAHWCNITFRSEYARLKKVLIHCIFVK